MVARSKAERMLSDDERALLALVKDEGPAGYPITKFAGMWSWEYRSLKAPMMYDTKDEAVHNLELQLSVLRDAERVEREREYAVEGRALRPADETQRAIAEPTDG